MSTSGPEAVNTTAQSSKRRRLSDTVPEDNAAFTRSRQSRSTYPRRRAVTACLACRERKKKCDNERPTCGFCRDVNMTCTYPEKGPSTFDSASLYILDRLAVIESSLNSIGREVSSLSVLPVTSPKRGRCPPDELPAGFPSASWPSLNLPSFSRVSTDSVLAWPVFQEALSQVPECTFFNMRGEIVSSYLAVSAPRRPGPGPATTRQQFGLSHLSIDWENLQPFLDQYFRNANIKNPVLSRSDVQRLYESICERGPAWDCSTCLILIVCAIGVLSPDWAYKGPHGTELETQGSPQGLHTWKELRMSDRFYQAAQELLGVAMVSLNLRSIQCLCLAGVYHMYRLDCITALRMFHMAGNALQASLSTTGTEIESTPLEKDETDAMQRLLWTSAKSEKELLAEVPIGTLGITHLKHLEQYPQPPKTSPSENAENDWQSIEDSWYYYLAEIALRRIADDIIHTFYPAEQKPDYYNASHPIQDLIPMAQEFARQLEGWLQSLPDSLSFPLLPEELGSEVRYFSRSRYYLVSELLHRPFVCYIIHNSTAAVNPEVLTLANKGLCYARDYLLASNHSHRHHGKWLQLRRELTAGCLLLAAAKSGFEMPENWYLGVERGRQDFEQWAAELPCLASFTRVLDAVEDSFQEHMRGSV